MRRRSALVAVFAVAAGVASVVASVFAGVVGVVGVVAVVSASASRQGSRRGNALSHGRGPAAPRSLWWVCGLLPGEEGGRWWAEVESCLAETPDVGQRRRFLRSYRRAIPQLIWTSWTEHLHAARRRELS